MPDFQPNQSSMQKPNIKTKLQIFLKNKFVLIVLGIFIIGGLSAFFLLKQNGSYSSNANNVEVVNVDAFILGGGLGGSASAIQMVKDSLSFVLSEQTNWLGGQATVQGVSTLDQNNKTFQKAGIYGELLENMQLDNLSPNGVYIGNATTGPGDLPKNIDSYLKSRLANYNNGKLLFNTELESVDKSGGIINSVTVHDRNQISKKYQIKAKYYLDSSDYADLTRMSGIETRYGLDTSEETKESIALTSKEKDILVNGTKYGDQKIGGLGNLVQPITTPFAILDKGYVGSKLNLNTVFPSQTTKCKNDKNRDCVIISTKLDSNNNLNYIGKYYFTFTFEGIVANTDLEIKINGDTTVAQPVAEKSNNQDYTIFKIPFAKETANLNFTILAKKNPLVLSDVISTYYNFEAQTTTETLKTVTDQATLNINIDKFKYDDEKKTYSLNFNDYKDKLDSSKTYYILSTFPTKNSKTLSRNISSYINAGGKNIFAVNYNPLFAFEEDYLPTYKLKFDETQNYQIAFINNDTKEKTIASSILVIEESKVSNFKMLLGGEDYTYPNSQFVDLSYMGLQKNLKVTKKDKNNQEEIFSNTINSDEKTPRIGIISRTAVSLNDNIYFSDKSKSSVLILKNLNQEHYFDQILNTFSSANTTAKQTIGAGNYDVYLKTTSASSKDDVVDIKFSSQSVDSIKRNQNLSPNQFTKISSFNLQNPEELSLDLATNCTTNCLKNVIIMITAKAPNSYDSGYLNRKISVDKNSLKVLYSSPVLGDDYFFKFRRIADEINIAKQQNIDEGTKNITSERSLGITQVNTGFNDFSLNGVDTNKYISDSNYQDSVNQNSKDYAQRYAYWLKYDVPTNYLGCIPQEVFCSSTRIEISPSAMGTKDGFAELPYVRDPVRPEGKDTITYNNISLNNNLCSDNEIITGIINSTCTELSILNVPEKLNVKTDFLESFPRKALFSYFYAADVHSILVGNDLKVFNDYLISNKLRTESNLPKFLPGIYDTSVRPYSVSYDNIHSSKLDNLLFCGKNISVSQIANGSTRLHPAEATNGQACGVIVNFLKKNGEQKITYLDIDQVFKTFRQDLVKNGVYPLPFEDNEFAKLYQDSKFDILNSYFISVQDGVLQPELIKNDVYQYAIYKFKPSSLANNKQFNNVFKAIKIDTSPSAQLVYTYKDLPSLIPNNDDLTKIQSTLLEYQNNLSSTKKIAPDYKITKGDLAYIYFKLGN